MLIKNAEVFCSDFKFRKTDLEFIGGRIETIPAVPPARDDSVLNLEGHYIVPGFIDIHIHGCNGHDIMDSEFSDNAIYEMDKFLLKNGVTSWCGTTMSYSKGSLNKIVSKGRMHTRAVSEANDQGRTHTRAVSEANDQGRTHTGMLGFHLEGPYISAQYKGAHESKYIYPYEEGDIKFDNIKLLTMAPEIKNAEKLMQKCRESKTIISLGHSGADFEESIRGIEMGGVCLTHIFNAMSPLNHRQPGLIGAAYEKNLFVQLIGDGIHISPTVVKMVFDLFGSEKVILISDAIRAAGLTDGEYSLVGQKVIVKNRKATLANGVIAGSSMLIPDMIKNLVSYGIRLEDVIRACTYNPAELLGLQKEKGVIESGAVADLVVLDRNLNVVHVFRNGIMVGCIPEQ